MINDLISTIKFIYIHLRLIRETIRVKKINFLKINLYKFKIDKKTVDRNNQ